MKKNNCNIIRDILPLYLDDVVSDETKQMVEEHLQSCASCRAEASSMKKDVILPASKAQRLAEAKVLKGIRNKIFRKKWSFQLPLRWRYWQCQQAYMRC